MVKLSRFDEAQLALWPEWYCHKCARSFDADVLQGPDGPDAGPPPLPDGQCPMRASKAGEVPACRLSLVDTWVVAG